MKSFDEFGVENGKSFVLKNIRSFSFPLRYNLPMGHFEKVVFALRINEFLLPANETCEKHVSLAGGENSLIRSAKTTFSKWLIGKLYRKGKEKERKGKGKKKERKRTGRGKERKGKERKGKEEGGKRKGRGKERKKKVEGKEGKEGKAGKERRKQGKGTQEERTRKNQETKGKLEVSPLGRNNLQKTLENLKFQLLTDVLMS